MVRDLRGTLGLAKDQVMPTPNIDAAVKAACDAYPGMAEAVDAALRTVIPKGNWTWNDYRRLSELRRELWGEE
jgi:hypothetical protein